MKKVLKIIGKGLSWAFTALTAYIFVSVVVCVLIGKLPTVFNRNYFIVVTDSMTPTIEVNELIISKKADIEDVKEGDIITFTCIDETQVVVGQIITHRVNKVENIDGVIMLTTKGDRADCLNDNKKVTEDNFVGIVTTHSKGIGKIVKGFTGNFSIFIFMFVIALLLMIMGYFIKNIYNEKKKLTQEKQEEAEKEALRKELLEEILQEQKGGRKEHEIEDEG